jgi:[protein-PII] uridylyltransferase
LCRHPDRGQIGRKDAGRWYGPAVSLRARRQSLIDRPDLRGDDFCRAYAQAADQWLTGLFDQAIDGDSRGLALVAVGGYGRAELCPYSDLDVILIHRGRRNIAATADRIWYPVWDEGISLDHSVRKPNEALDMAAEDLRVALGLLDARVICGDPKAAEPVIEGARDRWVKQKPPWLGLLADLVEERHRSYGDVGFLLEPDLKESHGGLRDIAALTAMMQAVPVLADFVDTVAIDDARSILVATRVELHRRAGREQNKLLLQEQDQVALALDLPDSDALMRAVATAGRTVAWEGDDAWRRRSAWSRSKASARTRRRIDADGGSAGSANAPWWVPGDPDIGIAGDEVVLSPSADVTGDPSLSLRLAALAAERNLPIARDALNLLGRKAPLPPDPWPDELRATLVRVLATGPPAIAALEALDQRRLLERYLPEWAQVRNRPQRNPYHRFTVDRHLLEATANAATLAHRVTRVDLLLLGALLHDIGKGFPGDHTEVGMVVVGEIGRRIGLPPQDVDALVTMVRLHLLLPDTATRRDLDDPATAERVAKEVGTRSVLELLAALVEADSLATGPSAWGTWKAGLVAELVERTGRLLAGEPVAPPTSWITDELRMIMDTVRTHGAPALSIEDPVVTVVAPDRSGLLAEVTGVLALHGLNVRSAAVAGEDGIAVEVFTVEPARSRWPEKAKLADDLAAIMAGTLSIDARLAERARTYRNERRAVVGADLVSTQVTVDNNASATATVVEVRAEDVVGQLHRITRALVECQLDVTSAKVSTFGSAVVDAFYVRGPDGGKVTDTRLIAAVELAIEAQVATAGPGDDAD